MPKGKEKHKGPVTKMPQSAPPPMKNNGPRPHGGDHSDHHSRRFTHTPFDSQHSQAEKKQSVLSASKTQRFFASGGPVQKELITLDIEEKLALCQVMLMSLNK